MNTVVITGIVKKVDDTDISLAISRSYMSDEGIFHVEKIIQVAYPFTKDIHVGKKVIVQGEIWVNGNGEPLIISCDVEDLA